MRTRVSLCHRLTQGAGILSVVLIGMLAVSLHAAVDQASEWAPYRRGLTLFRLGQWREAGELWLTVSQQWYKAAPDSAAVKHAALAQLLATIALEKANDVRAYKSWGTALQYYLEGNTDWPKEQQTLKERLRKLRLGLQTLQAEGGQPGVSEDALLLLQLENAVAFSTYSGPKPGLQRQAAPPPSPPDSTTTRDYLPRPLAVIEHAQPPQASPSSAAAPAGPASPAGGQASPLPFGPGWRPPTPEAAQATPPSPLVPTVTGPAGAPGQAAPTPVSPEVPGPIRRTLIPLETPAAPAPSSAEPSAHPVPTVVTSPGPSASPSSPLDEEIARAAWRYFAANQQANTGMFNSVHTYPYTTLWDLGSSLAGLVAAEQLGLLDYGWFTKHLGRLLDTLAVLPLYNQELPNREYHTSTGKMVDLKNRLSNTGTGSGWSAVDIGRVLIWLKIIATWYPDFAKPVDQIVQRWNFTRLRQQQEMHGTWFDGQREIVWQEGRLGYEQYAATGYALWDIPLAKARDYDATRTVEILGVQLLYDTRNPAFLTSEPFCLAQMELGGIDDTFRHLTAALYRVQKRRWEDVNVLTAVSEDALDREPWFAYNTIYMQGHPWQAVTHKGQPCPGCKTLSTKAALAWAAIFPEAYSQRLRDKVKDLVHPTYGYYAGVYDNGPTNKALNINTNAIILETMLYVKRNGKPFITLQK